MTVMSAVPTPRNEPPQDYAPGQPDRERLMVELAAQSTSVCELPMTIGGEKRMGTGAEFHVVQPHDHGRTLGVMRGASARDVQDAIDAAKTARFGWAKLSFEDRCAVFLKAADLLAGPWRERLVAATMLGQSKTAIQAEIDAASELVDFWRFNVSFAQRIMTEQPLSSRGVWNRSDHRPLDGFVYAVTPFNFTAIAGNLPTAPALMGNTVVWKPAQTQQLSASMTMTILEEAGLPAGVINLVTGGGPSVSEPVLRDPSLAGIHFTGSTQVFQQLWQTVAVNLSTYGAYPRLVGETGGKDFVLAHPSANPDVLRTALVRGAFEYQGQKCSAASRAYVPRSLWSQISDQLVDEVESLRVGDIHDLRNFMGAVIDRRAFERLTSVLEMAGSDDSLSVVAGGKADASVGYFVRPTVIVSTDPDHDVMRTEFFGPILSVYVFDDSDFQATTLKLAESSEYALTGSIIAQDRGAIAWASEALRFSAGNFYINDKPTGAVVGQQPFGGSRASGTNDKAGSAQNLLRWTSTRIIKETFVPPTVVSYPHMA